MDISFTTAEISIITALLGAMGAVISALFWQVIRLYNERLADKDTEIQFYRELHDEQGDLTDAATHSLKRRSGPRR